MTLWQTLSFPPKVFAGVLAVGLGVGVYSFAQYVAVGKVTFVSTYTGAKVVDPKIEIGYDAPVTLTRRSGKHTFTFDAPGYADREVVVRFPTFRQTRIYEITLEKALYSEDDAASAKSVPLGESLPYLENGAFEVKFPTEAGVYEVILLANPNWFPDDVAYNDGLKKLKQQALAWMRNKQVDPSTLKLKWVPHDPDR